MGVQVLRASCCAVVLMGSLCVADELALQRPSAVVLPAESSFAFVANEGTGVVSSVELTTGRIVAEFSVGQTLTDLIECPGRNLILAVDNQARCVRVLKRIREVVTEVQTLPLAEAPLRIALTPDGTTACVTYQWASHVTLLRLKSAANGSAEVSLLRDIVVGFPQLGVVALGHGQFIVADRFGGQLTVVDAATQMITNERLLHGHNIRGLTVESDGEHVLLAHQILSRVARTSFDDVHWGMVMQNVVRRIPTADVRDPQSNINKAGRMYRLGDTGNGFADPTEILAVEGGFAVLSGGTNQLMIMLWDGRMVARTTTGGRPTRMVRTAGNQFVVLNSLSNSVSVIQHADDDALTHLRTIGGAPPPASDGRGGEAAFFSSNLSHDGWMTCHSCHTDGHSPDLLADTLGDGVYGNPKRIPSLLGVADTGPWGWNGSKPTLHLQLQQTLKSTMHGNDHAPETINSLAAYLQTLKLPDSSRLADVRTTRGQELFDLLGCIRCHNADTWTSPQNYDVGLLDEAGQTEFNPPSLRGIRLRTRYFHDGRATSLESVFQDYRHNLKKPLNEVQLFELTEFLKTL